MSDAIPVYCRHCNEPLDVYQPFEDRFCSEDCQQAAAVPRRPGNAPVGYLVECPECTGKRGDCHWCAGIGMVEEFESPC